MSDRPDTNDGPPSDRDASPAASSGAGGEGSGGIDARLERELAGLADGSLDPERESALEALLADSPELERALREQRGALSLIARTQAVAAPESLHERVAALASERPSFAARLARAAGGEPRERTPRRWRTRRGATVLAASAAAAAAATLALSGVGGEGSAAPRMRAYLALATRPASAPPPRESAAHRQELALTVGGVAFPYWEDRFGWRAVGTRSDGVGGRRVTTVFYADGGGHRIAYSIVSGPAPAVAGLSPASPRAAWRGGTEYTVGSSRGLGVVTWVRAGRRCVVSGRDVPVATLLALASSGYERVAA
jgi:hypothetical protein